MQIRGFNSHGVGGTLGHAGVVAKVEVGAVGTEGALLSGPTDVANFAIGQGAVGAGGGVDETPGLAEELALAVLKRLELVRAEAIGLAAEVGVAGGAFVQTF